MTLYDDLFSVPEPTLVTINPPPYKVGASFRIFHDELDPDALTLELDVEPTSFHRKGDQRLGKDNRIYSPYRQGSWSLSSHNHIHSVDANHHIKWLLDKLGHCTGTIHRLQDSGYTTDIQCGWHTNGQNTCPSLNAETIARLARFRLDCWFDVYSY